MRIAIGSLGSERKSLSRISVLEEKLGKVRERPVVVGVVLFDKLDRREKIADRFLLLSASLIAQAKIVVGLVRSRIELQHSLELPNRMVDSTLMIVDAAEHVGAFPVVGVPVQQLDKSVLGSTDVS